MSFPTGDSPATEPRADLLAEVRGFLQDLARELPGLFAPLAARKPSAGRTARFRGEDRVLRVEDSPQAARSRVRESGGELVLVRSPEDPARPRDVLRDWYRDKARQAFSESSARWAAAMGVSFRGIRVKDQRSLWGSCSREGNLNFNWRLILAPPAVLDYLVIHELAHRVEMNHSRRFWGLVAAQCPDWRAQRRWLREHAGELKNRARY